MHTLSITSRGRLTIPREVLRHLGIKPGGKVELELLPGGIAILYAARPSGSIEKFIGLLAGRTKGIATVDEINQAAAEGWAGQVK
jgi:AbrB family looped-hinge helix DNA binding protein